jgi:hypothetical protein
MRKVLITIAAAASSLTIAAPASAQWVPPVYRYQPYVYGPAFSYRAFASSMQARVARIRSDIGAMQARRVIAPWQARNLDIQAAGIQRRIFFASRNGIQPYEARNLEYQIRNLEIRVQRAASWWHRRPGWRRY